MKERRKRIMKRLLMEELERRALLADIAMAASAETNGSVEDFYKSQVGTEAGGAAGVGMFDNNIGPIAQNAVPAAGLNATFSPSAAAEATTGVGQMVITTGANTPGIGSFAMPIAGPSRAGGTGNPRTGGAKSQADVARATDAAIESLDAEPHDALLEEIARLAEPKKTAGEAKVSPSTRRAWSIETGETQMWHPRRAEPSER